jgi:hypothetical protein
MVNVMITNFIKNQHGIIVHYLQNNIITGRKIVRFTRLLQFVVDQDLNLVNLIEKPIGGCWE